MLGGLKNIFQYDLQVFGHSLLGAQFSKQAENLRQALPQLWNLDVFEQKLYRPQNYCSLQIFFIQVRNVMQYVLKLGDKDGKLSRRQLKKIFKAQTEIPGPGAVINEHRDYQRQRSRTTSDMIIPRTGHVLQNLHPG